MLAVIYDSDKGKIYKLPTKDEKEILNQIPDIDGRPTEAMSTAYTRALTLCLWNISQWGQMFSNRQLLAMLIFVKKINEIKDIIKNGREVLNSYEKAVITMLSIWIDKIVLRMTSYGIIDTGRETIVYPFGRQAIPMVFDYPEVNIFTELGGGPLSQLEWLTRYICEESPNNFYAICNNTSSGSIIQYDSKSLNCVVTDPPYYDAIAYADLSDFFYVWLKRTIFDLYPENFAFPLTPKSEECTALKHHHNGTVENAKKHFEDKLRQIFTSIECQTSGLISIMFAHQSTEAWTTLCNSILNSQMNISGSWSMNTELTSALKSDKAFLASSVTVACRPSSKSGYGDFKEIKRAIDNKIKDEVKILYDLGFRGADLLTACFGQAVSEFGKYEKVEKADGTEVSVADLLETARESAFKAIVSDIETDDFTKFYIGWLNLFGFSQAEHDDVRRITQIGLNIDTAELNSKNILLKNGNRESLAGFSDRIIKNKALGDYDDDIAIDKAHKVMHLYSGSKRENLLFYLAKHGYSNESSLWRVLNSLMEIIPPGTEDHKQISGLIANKESLIRDAKAIKEGELEQRELF